MKLKSVVNKILIKNKIYHPPNIEVDNTIEWFIKKNLKFKISSHIDPLVYGIEDLTVDLMYGIKSN